jgi:hypothetical protein
MSPITLIPCLIALGLSAQAASSDDVKAHGAARLAFMNESMKTYAITPKDAREPLRLVPEPAFRHGGQSDQLLDGAIFLWTDGVGRPAAAAQVMLWHDPTNPKGSWTHEFTSLALAPLMTTGRNEQPVWHPDKPGVQFQAVPAAPKPATTPAARLRQMRALAEEFRVEDALGKRDNWTVLRLLTTPIARYGKAGDTPTDGALFAFVTGTDPDAFLFLEVRDGPSGPEWQYAFAPMSCWALKASRKGRIAWELEDRYGQTFLPHLVFFDYPYKP